MRKIELSYQLSAQRERGTLIRNQLMDLLQAVRAQGSISGAARCLSLSYRHVWGLLKEWEQTVGQDLIVWERGQSAQLTPFADKLLWTERLAQARLAPQIEALRAELERTLALAFDEASHVLSLYASHDDALPLLMDHATGAARLHLDIRFCGSVDAIRALNEGRSVLAGFHVREKPPADSLSAQAYRGLLQPGQHKLIGFARRTQGLIVAPGNPMKIDGLPRAALWRARFVNRALGTGTRVLLDELLDEAGVAPEQLNGYERSELSHAAVAQAIANGSADVGLGTEASARRLGLGFVPLAQENYHLVCLKSALEQPAVRALREVLATPAWQALLSGTPGCAPQRSGEVLSLRDALPWWKLPPRRMPARKAATSATGRTPTRP
ncbi:substrate-binding domain-containing protein [Hydrogenophaga sp. OTU3427]|uniref:substrate-binding domain-containing protein n=1 Tax=Hydrogenophaga sp. OTU3427 TaxID=3043856 RepID=UPI00313BD850